MSTVRLRRRGVLLRVLLLLVLGQPLGAVAGAQDVPKPVDTSSAARGWRPFTIAKPPSDAPDEAELDPRRNDPRWQPRRPPTSDFFKSTIGLGHVLQNDWGLELSGSGRVGGFETNLSSFLTIGPAGIEAPAARLSLLAPGGRWGAEAGDLVTQTRGLARGFRVSGKAGKAHRPMFSVYLPSARLRDTATLVGIGDQVRLFSRIVAGGEATSDGSYFLRAAYLQTRFDLQGSYRQVRRDDAGKDAALMASYVLGHGVMVRAGVRTFETSSDRGKSRLAALRIPLGKVLDVTLETTRTAGSRSHDVSNAIVLQVLQGPVRLSQRYQWGDSEYLHVGGPFGIEQRQLQTSASFSPTRWATFSPQTVTQWLPDGRARVWQELQSALTLSRTTRLQASTTFPDVLDPARFRARLAQDLPRQFTLLVEYGRVSPFQPVMRTDAGDARLSMMVRKSWRTATPARGGEISGRVVDERGNPVAGAGLRLGPYLVFTDDSGHYAFSRVPPGEFDLALATELLPAGYASEGVTHRVFVNGTGRQEVNFTATPLNAIRGRVYQDVNKNGRFDAGEGRAGIALRTGEHVTATDADGAYGFFNLEPGRYTVQLDTDRLGDGYAAASEPAITVQLDAGRPAVGVDFTLTSKQRPVVLQKVTR